MKTFSRLILIALMAASGAILLGRPRALAAAYGVTGSSASQASESALEDQIVAKEREGLDALKAGNVELFGKLTADDALLLDAHGPASKAQVLQNVAGFTLTDYSMEGMKFIPLSGDSGLISYKISEKGNSHGKEFTAQAYISSIWARRAGNWVCLFSQETAAR
jgi:ketosteroid isomerase-like protein